MWDVVGVGANSLDLVYVLPDYPRPDGHAKLPILSHRLSPGGQVATALSTCAAMGLRTAYVGATGHDEHARLVREALQRRGVDLTHAVTREAANPFAVILLDERRGERVVLWHREPVLALDPGEIPAAAIGAARLVHVDDVDEAASIRAAILARAAGVPVTSDIEKVTPRTMDLVDAVSVPIFGEQVPEALTGEADPERALRTLRRRHAGLLVATLGADGAMLLEGDRLIRAPAAQVQVVDTTGAGDVFRGAFIVAMLRGDAPEAMLRFANAAAAVSCTRMGAIASVPTLDEVEALAHRRV
jgi:sugar/nucleoside kinase (ribokinase family)